MKNQTKLSDAAVQSIRDENKTLIDKGFYKKHARRYRMLAGKWNCSEWTIRWLCQGRSHKHVGGYVEDATLHNRSASGVLTSAHVKQIQDYHKGGTPVDALASMYGVSTQTIKRVLTGQTYRDITPSSTTTNAPTHVVLKNRPAPRSYGSYVVTNPATNKNIPAAIAPAVNLIFGSLKSKLNNVDAFLIRMNHKLGQSTIDLAIQYGVSENEIRDILSGACNPNAAGPKS